MVQYDREQWAELATRGIVSGREREKARRELLDHMEDHMDSFLALGYIEEDALQHTLLAMGDPSLTAKLLRRAHQPVLTWVLRVCRVAALFLAVVLVWNLCLHPNELRQAYLSKPAAGSQQGIEELPRREVPLEQTVRVGEYTLRVTSARVLQVEDLYRTSVFLEATPDRLWQDEPRLRGKFASWVNGEPLTDRQDMGMSGFSRRLNTFHGYFWFDTSGEPRHLTVQYTGKTGETVLFDFDLTGGTVYEAAE